MKTLFAIAIGAIALTGCATSKPMEIDRTKARDIPLYLFTNLKDGETKTTQYPYDSKPVQVAGPEEWTHPDTGKTYTTYHVVQYSKMLNGTRDRRFIIREDGLGLARVYDSLMPKDMMYQENKFPMGKWFQGETKTFGPITITMRDINYGGSGGIQYDWVRGNECWRYSYGYNKGRESISRC